jgi:phosphate transport system substrate-binding protein
MRIFPPALLLLWLAACSGSSARTLPATDVVLAGSTSVQPFAERWAEVYAEESGSGQVTVQAGGSTAGIRAARAGTAHLGMSSRALDPGEMAGLHTVTVARDGIAVIVHATNPLRALSLEQLRAIYTGTIRSWRALGGRDAPITVITREDGSGTRDAFEHLVLAANQSIDARALVTAYSGGLRKMVAEDPQAIGYVTFSQVDERVRAVSIEGVMPSEHTIASGQYRLQRPFLFVSRGAVTGAAKRFVDFVLSPRGQQLARNEGLAPVSLAP